MDYVNIMHFIPQSTCDLIQLIIIFIIINHLHGSSVVICTHSFENHFYYDFVGSISFSLPI